jgi:aspartyl-tRNA(Asn)/glutamyl-tRNA(Gln) amidotransferase subunit A
MTPDEICWMSALELIGAYRRKEVSPVEVVRSILERVERVNPIINAIVTLTPDLAIEQAREAEAAYLKGEAGPLAGVPVTIKDIILTKGIRTTFGCRLYENLVPGEDAILVDRLKRAGVAILGKTNVPDLALMAVTDNLIFGPARNPWDIRKTTGGSSGGAGGALAAGLGPIAAANDGGGSIRIPAHLCGVFGLKPQFGRVPSYPHVFHGGETTNHEGPMARTVADAALMLDVMAGPDERDRSSLPPPGVSYLESTKGGIKGLKVAYSTGFNVPAIERDVLEVVGKAAAVFEELGCDVTEDDPGIPDLSQDLVTIMILETAAAHEDHLEEAKEKLFPLYRPFLDLPSAFSSMDYVRACYHKEDMWQKLWPFFEEYDLLLTPTAACAAFDLKEGGSMGPETIDGKEAGPTSIAGFTVPFNYTGQPAASVPCGFTGGGLPVGLQIVGRRFDEATVLRAAAAFEEARPWAGRHPEL